MAAETSPKAPTTSPFTSPIELVCTNIHGFGRLLSSPVRSIPGRTAAYNFDLVQAWDQVVQVGKSDAEVGNNGLELSSPLHSAEPFLWDRASKKVENFDLTVEASPDTEAMYHHLKFVVAFSPVVTWKGGRLDNLAVGIHHLPSSHSLAQLLQTSRRG